MPTFYCVSLYDLIHLCSSRCIRCVMQHCLSLVSSMLRCQLTAVLGDSFVLLSYLCAQRSSGKSHPTRSPHSPSVYIKLNLSSTSGNAEVGYLFLPTQKGNSEVGVDFQIYQLYANVTLGKTFYLRKESDNV